MAATVRCVLLAWILGLTTACCLSGALAFAAPAKTVGQLSAEQIVAKNVVARGGLEAWRKVQTMVWIGHLESEHAPLPSMGFILEQARPNKTRFQLVAMNTRSVRTFNGVQGWKIRPSRETRSNVEPYSIDELRFAQTGPGIQGPLIDYALSGSTVSLDGVEEIEGRKAYRLTVQSSSNERDQVWVDAESFLDLRYDRPFHTTTGAVRTVSVTYRDYKSIGGVLVPSTILTTAAAGSTPDRMVIERVVVNSPLEDRIFGNPANVAQPRLSHVPSRSPVRASSATPAPAPAGAAPEDPGSSPQ
jgi:hypothetical protein